MNIIKFRPHVVYAEGFFQFNAEKRREVRSLVFLILYQHFLGSENHSHRPYKARIEFCTEKGDAHPRQQLIVDGVNRHHYWSFCDNDDWEGLAVCNDARKWGLRLTYFPQVPCKPFRFPVRSVEEAIAFKELLLEYEHYLFEICENMRVDYCNVIELETLEDGDWISWEKITDDDCLTFNEYCDSMTR